MRILSKIQPTDYLMFFIPAQLISIDHPKHAISDYLHWRNNLCILMQNNLICEYNDYKMFLGSHIPISFYNKTTLYSRENKIIINALVFVRGHIVLFLCALFCSFIVALFSVLFII